MATPKQNTGTHDKDKDTDIYIVENENDTTRDLSFTREDRPTSEPVYFTKPNSTSVIWRYFGLKAKSESDLGFLFIA